MKRLLLVGVTCLAMLPMTAFARGRIRRTEVCTMRFTLYGGYGWYGPCGMYLHRPYFCTPNAGEVKLDTKVKDAEVFIDGNYAGTVGELKTISRHPSSYDLQVRASGRMSFQQRIYVLAGKTIKLQVNLRVQAPLAPTGT